MASRTTSLTPRLFCSAIRWIASYIWSSTLRSTRLECPARPEREGRPACRRIRVARVEAGVGFAGQPLVARVEAGSRLCDGRLATGPLHCRHFFASSYR
jgi:hypothetical protein